MSIMRTSPAAFRAVFWMALGSLVLGCSSETLQAASTGQWQGREEALDATTREVVTVSGGVWDQEVGGQPSLEIGLAEGPDEYMFGNVAGVAELDGHVIVADPVSRSVRVFDAGGVFVRQLGRVGQGPGEYEQPVAVKVSPTNTILVQDAGSSRLSEFSFDGESLGSYQLQTSVTGGVPIEVSADGAVWTRTLAMAEFRQGNLQYGYQKHVDGAAVGAPLLLGVPVVTEATQVTIRRGGSSGAIDRPFHASPSTAVLPNGATVWGHGDDYVFDIRSPSGEVLRVRKEGASVGIAPNEAAWHALRVERFAQRLDPSWKWNDDFPVSKPAFKNLIADRLGRVWVLRVGPGIRLDPCDEEIPIGGQVTAPCWTDAPLLDVFAADGKFLGELVLHDEVLSVADVFGGDGFALVAYEDLDGTHKVARYELPRQDG